MIDPITGPVEANPAAAGETAASALGDLQGDAFLKLLVAQLRYQNPMEPTNGTEFLQQTAQFTQVETLNAISISQKQLMGLQQVGVALGIVGHEITAADADGGMIRGTVDGLRFAESGPVLQVAGVDVALDAVLSIESGDAPQFSG